MKKRFISFTIAFVLLMSLLAFPAFAQKDANPLISASNRHWAQDYVDDLASRSNIDAIFRNKSLNAPITVEDFQNLVRLVIDETYDGAPDSTLREAIVYECARIWAEKTGNNLDEMVFIQVVFYSDMDQADAKYVQGIYAAYTQEIARGRGNDIFDPKAQTTYGELATLISRTVQAIEKASAQAPQPIVAGRFETRATYAVKADKVVFDFELMSHYTEPRDITFSSGQQFELTITDESGKEVYRYSDGRFFTMALILKTINPGESLKWQDEWDMTDKDGNRLTSGNYKAVITILAYPDEGGEKLDESQFTATIDFSL